MKNRASLLSKVINTVALETPQKVPIYEILFDAIKNAIPLNEHLEFHLAQLNKLNF